jgi:hypothetical protein
MKKNKTLSKLKILEKILYIYMHIFILYFCIYIFNTGVNPWPLPLELVVGLRQVKDFQTAGAQMFFTGVTLQPTTTCNNTRNNIQCTYQDTIIDDINETLLTNR